MEQHKFLRTAQVIFKVFAWLSAALGLISGLVIIIGGGTAEAPRPVGLVALLFGILYFFIFYSVGAIIRLLFEIDGKLTKLKEGSL